MVKTPPNRKWDMSGASKHIHPILTGFSQTWIQFLKETLIMLLERNENHYLMNLNIYIHVMCHFARLHKYSFNWGRETER